MKFKTSNLANQYLKGLKGVEVGGSAHNSYDLDTINVDYTQDFTIYKQQEIELCGSYMPVDIVADAAKLPFDNKSYDFIISSHMLEHHYNPILVLKEWARVASKYIFITVPRKDLTFDKDKPVTLWHELVERYHKPEIPENQPSDDHWNIWDVEQFRFFCEMIAKNINAKIIDFQEIDDKVGNGMTVLFMLNEQ